MTTPIRPNPIRMRDEDGKPIVKIALNRRGTQHAFMDAADHDALPSGISRNFLLNDDGKGHAYVKVSCSKASGNLVMLSRVITGAGRGRKSDTGTEVAATYAEPISNRGRTELPNGTILRKSRWKPFNRRSLSSPVELNDTLMERDGYD